MATRGIVFATLSHKYGRAAAERMSKTGEFTAESKVGESGKHPARIRRELGIEGGDRLRWTYTTGRELQVEVVHRRKETFDGFSGYDGGPAGDIVEDHDKCCL